MTDATSSEASAPPLTIAYLIKGFTEIFGHKPEERRKAKKRLVSRYESELDFYTHLCEIADQVELSWKIHVSEDSWAGVWDYDVSEPLGWWLGEYVLQHGELPSDALIEEKILELIKTSSPCPEEEDAPKVKDEAPLSQNLLDDYH